MPMGGERCVGMQGRAPESGGGGGDGDGGGGGGGREIDAGY